MTPAATVAVTASRAASTAAVRTDLPVVPVRPNSITTEQQEHQAEGHHGDHDRRCARPASSPTARPRPPTLTGAAGPGELWLPPWRGGRRAGDSSAPSRAVRIPQSRGSWASWVNTASAWMVSGPAVADTWSRREAEPPPAGADARRPGWPAHPPGGTAFGGEKLSPARPNSSAPDRSPAGGRCPCGCRRRPRRCRGGTTRPGGRGPPGGARSRSRPGSRRARRCRSPRPRAPARRRPRRAGSRAASRRGSRPQMHPEPDRPAGRHGESVVVEGGTRARWRGPARELRPRRPRGLPRLSTTMSRSTYGVSIALTWLGSRRSRTGGSFVDVVLHDRHRDGHRTLLVGGRDGELSGELLPGRRLRSGESHRHVGGPPRARRRRPGRSRASRRPRGPTLRAGSGAGGSPPGCRDEARTPLAHGPRDGPAWGGYQCGRGTRRWYDDGHRHLGGVGRGRPQTAPTTSLRPVGRRPAPSAGRRA